MKNLTIEDKHIGVLLLFMLLAYLFSIGIRMYWPIHFADNESFRYAGELMINTNDGYFFATGARDILEGISALDKQRASAFHVSPGLVLLTAYITKFTPFSLETVILYLPAIISSFIVIPIILTARLVGHTLIGFFAALLGSIAWSYYNRTMTGYYDTDMFSVLLQFGIFYSFMHIVYKKDLTSILLASFLILIYPYFYPQGMTIVYAMFVMLVVYLTLEYKGWIKSAETDNFKKGAISLYGSVILLSIVLMTSLPVIVRAVIFIFALIILLKMKLEEKKLLYIALLFFLGYLVFGNIFGEILRRVFSFLDRGVDAEGLHFYQVIQTVREAGAIPFSTMANRISGSQIGVLLSLVGYIVLVIRHKPFIVALPMIGVGVLSLWAGLRFTVYAVPIAAISSVYLFYVIADKVTQDPKVKYALIGLATAAMLYPNIIHVIGYKVPTVFNKAEVNDLVKLDEISDSKDYTLTWWDYGYPIWFYSNTNTLIDGGKHGHDNYLISKIMQTTSPELAANLSRLAVETYIESNYSIVSDTIFKNGKEDQRNPNSVLSELENSLYALPPKTRDIYLYLPYRMLNIFPTVTVFGNLDLNSGKAERKIAFYPTSVVSNKEGVLTLRNGIVFDAKKGVIILGQQRKKVTNFIITQNMKNGKTQLQSQYYHEDGEYAIIYMRSYGQIIVMDRQTFHSMYVQMFILGKYDKKLFELVVSSPYSKIYKLKI
jgi:dolichyl-diphosphooligosaccharide--protein glycosyltransferase/undecaprenyl-diphosphooligosaccharide--protein glycosyltransferase